MVKTLTSFAETILGIGFWFVVLVLLPRLTPRPNNRNDGNNYLFKITMIIINKVENIIIDGDFKVEVSKFIMVPKYGNT